MPDDVFELAREKLRFRAQFGHFQFGGPVLPGVTQLPLAASPSPRSICSWAHKSRAVRFWGSFASAFSKSTSAAGKLAAARSACAVAEKLRRIFHRRGARAARQPTK